MVDTAPILEDANDFSLVLGGPLYQLFMRSHLSGPALELLRRRIAIITALAWTPLAILTLIEGHFFGKSGLMFLHDIETHVRFLVALPILIAAELVVHQRMRPVVKAFLQRRLVTPAQTPTFNAAIESAMRMRNSVTIEVALVLIVYTAGHWLWRDQVALEATTWYASPVGTHLHLTLAGYWNAFVSVPIFQFILIRWYFRILIWFLFLFRVSRLDLSLLPAHPDRAGGLGFLGKISFAFSPLLFAQGAVLAGVIASRIFYQGQNLLTFKSTIAGYIAFVVFAVLAPLLLFTPQLARAKREGLNRYGAFVTTYVSDFDQKWLHTSGTKEKLLGTGDIQSLADLGTSFTVVREMKTFPFGTDDITRLAFAAALPCLPLLLTIMPLDALIGRLLKILF
jgi:hypothetical protein